MIWRRGSSVIKYILVCSSQYNPSVWEILDKVLWRYFHKYKLRQTYYNSSIYISPFSSIDHSWMGYNFSYVSSTLTVQILLSPVLFIRWWSKFQSFLKCNNWLPGSFNYIDPTLRWGKLLHTSSILRFWNNRQSQIPWQSKLQYCSSETTIKGIKDLQQ